MNLLLDSPSFLSKLPFATAYSHHSFERWQHHTLPSYRCYQTRYDGEYIMIESNPSWTRLAMKLADTLPQEALTECILSAKLMRLHRAHNEGVWDALHRDILLIHKYMEFIPFHLQHKILHHLYQFTGKKQSWPDYTAVHTKERAGIWGVSEKNYFIVGDKVQGFTLYHEHITPWFKGQHLLHSLELDSHMKEEETLALLEQYEAFCQEHSFLNPIHLKFKKIGHTKKTGIWNHSLNTMIIDPRHAHALWHELGHRIYQHGGALYALMAERVKNHIVSDEWLMNYRAEKRDEERFAMQFEMEKIK